MKIHLFYPKWHYFYHHNLVCASAIKSMWIMNTSLNMCILYNVSQCTLCHIAFIEVPSTIYWYFWANVIVCFAVRFNHILELQYFRNGFATNGNWQSDVGWIEKEKKYEIEIDREGETKCDIRISTQIIFYSYE